MHVYEAKGRIVRVNDSLSVALRLQELAEDPDLSERDKSSVALRLLFPDPEGVLAAFGDDAAEAVGDLIAQAFAGRRPGEGQGEPSHEPQPFDWDEDRARIVATAKNAYGLTWDELLAARYVDAIAMIALSPHETPMGQAIYYRTADPPKPTKYNREEVERFRDLKRHYALSGRRGAAMEQMSDALSF